MAKRRTFTAEFKARIVLEAINGVKSSAEICREHNLKPQLLSRWKAEFLENAPKVFEADERRSVDRVRIHDLERLLGQKTVELEIAKKASNIRNVHFKMSHLGLERRPHSQRNVGAFVMIIPQPLFHLKGELRDF